MEVLHRVLAAYGIDAKNAETKQFGTGLINHTWKIITGEKNYILQRINQSVFTDPHAIDANIRAISLYLAQHHPEYLFVSPVNDKNGNGMVEVNEGVNAYYRLFPFVNGSHSKDVVKDKSQAFEAAAQFGRFTRLLSGFDSASLQVTLPSFHDLGLRYQQFLQSLQTAMQERLEQSAGLIAFMKENAFIVTEFENIRNDPSFRLRVTHHDTKISNVLFNDHDEAICVIDLDTVMPGYFISDVGDMMRTYLPTVNEEEADFSKIQVRDDVYKAIVIGYYAEMEDELTPKEIQYFFYAARFMIYMQALRFLTDHLSNDSYYGAKYPGHNFVRAGNQVVLYERLMEKKNSLHA